MVLTPTYRVYCSECETVIGFKFAQSRSHVICCVACHALKMVDEQKRDERECDYPDCDCPISFPVDHKPSLATECPRDLLK